MLQLLPQSFTFSNYNAEIPFEVFVDDTLLLKWLKQQEIIGYNKCSSYKQEKDYTAVLIHNKTDGWKAWSHIPDRVWQKFMKWEKEKKNDN